MKCEAPVPGNKQPWGRGSVSSSCRRGGRGGRRGTLASAGEGRSQKPDMQGDHEHKDLGWGGGAGTVPRH